ncbi:MAG: N-acetylgalactosamine 6-sulfate sulfatase [Planctomycetota bacterium]|nr:MAG: N-acetylgalactosamine 6-sulfate sulfatase [Planctomycetota bacterium]
MIVRWIWCPRRLGCGDREVHCGRQFFCGAVAWLLVGTLAVFAQRAVGDDVRATGARDGAVAGRSDRPNVLIILVDDLGYGDLSCYGARDLRTPNIDALVAAGMRFDNFYANCPVCSPTRAALLTGRYQELVGVPGVIRTHPENNWGYLSPKAVLLPAVLKPLGYTTAIIGKWHLGLEAPNIPTRRGFDFFHGFLGDMMDDYYTHRRHGINYMRRNEEEIDPPGHATDLFTDWACAYLRARAEREQPFFLYLAYNAPHTPIQPPRDWLERVKAREQSISERRARLVALIEHLDAGIGRVMATLKETGLAANTFVAFTSDNGGQLSAGANNGRWRDGKQSVYEGGIRVPAAFVWPGRIPRGRTTLRAMSMDIFATVCDLVGAKVAEPIDGVSFLPTLLGRQQAELRRFWFFTRREGGLAYGGKTIEAVISGDWKLLQNSPFAPQELYNLRADPREQNDLARKNRAKFNELAAALRRHIQRGGAVPWQKPTTAYGQ